MPELTPEERRQIYEEEKAQLESEHAAEPAKARQPHVSRKLLISILCSILLLGAAVSIGYHQYRLSGLKQKLGEAIGKDLGLTETILRVESESSKITYGEFFELCNKSVENRTNLVV